MCWEISAPKLSEPSKLWIRLADILRSGCRNIFRGGSSLNTKSCDGRKTWCSDAPIRSQHPEAEPAIRGQAAYKRRGATDRAEYRQGAGAIAQAMKLKNEAAPVRRPCPVSPSQNPPTGPSHPMANCVHARTNQIRPFEL